jgi:hypothetical protein
MDHLSLKHLLVQGTLIKVFSMGMHPPLSRVGLHKNYWNVSSNFNYAGRRTPIDHGHI